MGKEQAHLKSLRNPTTAHFLSTAMIHLTGLFGSIDDIGLIASRSFGPDIHSPKLFKPNDFTIPWHCLHSKFSRILTNLSTSVRVASKMFCTDMKHSLAICQGFAEPLTFPQAHDLTWHDLISLLRSVPIYLDNYIPLCLRCTLGLMPIRVLISKC